MGNGRRDIDGKQAGGGGDNTDAPAPDLRHSRAREHAEALAIASSKRRQHVLGIMSAMARGLWERGKTGPEYAAEHQLEPETVRHYAAEASRLLSLLGQREEVLAIVRSSAYARIDGAEDRDLVALLRLLTDTVGGFEQKHRLDVTVAAKPDGELLAGVVRELGQREDGRELMRAELARWDTENGRLLDAAGEEVSE